MGKFKVGDKGCTDGGWAYEVKQIQHDSLNVRHDRKGHSPVLRIPNLDGTLCTCSFCLYQWGAPDADYTMEEAVKRADPIPAAITEYHDACAEFEAAQLAVEKAKSRIEDARLALKEALS